MTIAPVAQSIREAKEERPARFRANVREQKSLTLNGHNSFRTVRQMEEGIRKAEASRLFAKIAAVAERPAGKLRAELIPESSWKRSGERLRPTASQTVARLQRVVGIATGIWQDERRAIEWLIGKHRLLGRATPYSLLRTEAGGRRVEDLLAALDNGFPV